MTKSNRTLLALAALLLLGVHVAPIWKISLEAPQYPEGLGMYIYVDTVTGEKEHDLNNINNLNHYIGMKRIEPDAIPELRYMPWLMGGLVVLGLGAAVVGRRWALYAWLGLFFVLAVAGLVDFYLWEYDYGHNLDMEHAIIKIPGMSYQPPLIGSKQLLNFTAHSWPALGGLLVFASFGLGLFVGVREYLRGRRSGRNTTAMKTPAPAFAALAFAVLLAGCSPEPRAIRYGEEQCDHCKMTVSDERYGAELVTATGKVRVFDSVECLAAHRRAQPTEEVHSLWVTDFSNPPALVSVEDAFFLHSPNLNSPMGANLTAFGAGMTPDAAVNAFAGRVVGWEDVLGMVGGKANASMHRGE